MIYTNTFLNKLKSLGVCYISQGAQRQYITIRCPFCGDSIKHPNKGHLGIFGDAPVFKCVRCDQSGSLKALFQILFNEPFSKSLFIKPEYQNASYGEILRKEKIKTFNQNLLGINKHNINSLSKTKEDYLKSRIGVGEIPKWLNSIIVNDPYFLQRFFKKSEFERYYNNYIFFRGVRGYYINGRNIDKNSKYRYVQRRINGVSFDFVGYPNPNKKISREMLLTKDAVNVCVGEGIFDILKLTLTDIDFPKLKENVDLYYMAAGKNYSLLIKYLISFHNYFKYNFYVLLDEDSDYEKIKKQLRHYKLHFNSLIFFKIKNKKDFGELEKGDVIDIII